MDIIDAEKVIRSGIEARKADGWKIVRGLTRSDNLKMCCALGACGFYKPQEAASALGWNASQIQAFVDGFDGMLTEDVPHARLGQRLATEYIKAAPLEASSPGADDPSP